MKTQQKEFDRDGYLVFDTEIPQSFFSVLCEETDRLISEHDNGRGRVQDAWEMSYMMKQIALLPLIREKVSEMHGGKRADAFQTLNFRVGTEQKFHSDTIHFQSEPANLMAAAWVAFEPTDSDYGPLQVVPGSHLWPTMTMQDFGFPPDSGNYAVYNSCYEPAIQDMINERGVKPVQVHLKPGQCLIWAANLLHGGSPIVDRDRTRRSMVTHYFLGGADSYWTPLLSGNQRRMRIPKWIR